LQLLAMLIALGVTVAVGFTILIAVILLQVGLTPFEVVTVLIGLFLIGSALSVFIMRKLAKSVTRLYRRLREKPTTTGS